MARCEGTTKDGARCRRPATAETRFCSWHAAQVDSETEPAPSESASASGSQGEKAKASKDAESASKKARAASSGRRPRKKHPLSDVALVGIVAIVLLALRRVIRF